MSGDARSVVTALQSQKPVTNTRFDLSADSAAIAVFGLPMVAAAPSTTAPAAAAVAVVAAAAAAATVLLRTLPLRPQPPLLMRRTSVARSAACVAVRVRSSSIVVLVHFDNNKMDTPPIGSP